MPNMNELKELINSLSLSEKQELQNFLAGHVDDHDIASAIENARFSNGIYCPKCGCFEHIVKFGKYKELQRYKCKDCGSTFTAQTGSILHKSTKSIETWKKYIDCLLKGLPLRKSAQVCEISLPTAFYWRHKILEAIGNKLENNLPKLKGIVESDETYFRLSFKGSRKLPTGRNVHRRGEKASKRGLSKEQVCVTCGLDRQGSTLSKLSNLGKISASDLTKVYSGRVEKQSVFCTDSEKAYIKFSQKKGYGLIQIERGKHKLGIYHINHVNAFHNNLKRFIDKFRGVSTKYLGNYLTWNLSGSMSSYEVLTTIGSNPYFLSCKAILNRPAVPVK